MTGIPPTSCEFGISPVYFSCTDDEQKDIDEFTYLAYPVRGLANAKLISLSRILMATFIYHESFTVTHTPVHSLLMNSLYFQFSNTYQSRRACVTTSLPWQNHPNCPVITGIPMHCTLLNKIMEIHQMQTALPDQMVNMIV